MDQDEILYRLLTDANEDCTRFWDAVWEVAGDGDEASSDARYRAAIPEAQRLMHELLRSGLVTIYRGPDYQSGLGADGEFEVSAEEGSAIIADPASWQRPSDDERVGVYFCFYTTEAGKQLWYKGSVGFRLPGRVPVPPVSEAEQPAP